MTRPHSMHLTMLECAGLAGPSDVVALVEALRPIRLALGNGAWTFDGHPSPADDVARTLAERHLDWQQIWPSAKARPRDPLKHTETWGSSLLRLDQPHTFATLGITRRGWDVWDVSLMASPTRLRQAQLTLDEFVESWQSALERVGDVLYERTRPSIGLIYDSGRTVPDFARPGERQIGVAWRTWYGPAFVESHAAGCTPDPRPPS